MKKSLLSLISFTFSLVGFSQQTKTPDANEQKSKIEVFSAKSGTLIKKEFYDVGNLKGCQIQVLKVTDINNGESFSAVRFEIQGSSMYNTSSKIALLDADEVDGLIKFIKMIQDKILITSPDIYTEVVYKSRSGFQAGCYKSKKDWSPFMKLEQFDSNSSVYFKDNDLNQLLTILIDAKEKL